MMTPDALPGIQAAIDFRAPPPSPVAPGRRPSFANDDVLTEYLHQSLRVPDLILPDKVFPRQRSLRLSSAPTLDLRDLETAGAGVAEAAAQLGFLEVINHGVPTELIEFVVELGNGIFSLAPEKKKTAARSPPEKAYGFEEVHDEEQGEEFVWCADETLRLEMEGIWPFRYSNFSQEMEKLSARMEGIAHKVVQFLHRHCMIKVSPGYTLLDRDNNEEPGHIRNVCCMHKHPRGKKDLLPLPPADMESALRYDVVRMLIRGCEFPHTLCLHICNGTVDFHAYSKKGWLTFCPHPGSVIVTIGDMLQAQSCGQYKHVIGRPVFKGEDERQSGISMGFLYSPSKTRNNNVVTTISITHQITLAVLITLVYQLSLYLYKKI